MAKSEMGGPSGFMKKQHAFEEPKRGKGGFKVEDNKHAYEVKDVSTSTQQDDASNVKLHITGNKGYPGEAWDYNY